MTATAARYRAPFCTQRGIDSTLDDCAVVATIHCLAYATLGEYVTMPTGREMGKAQLHALARRMRKSLGPSEATGGLTIAQRQQMCRNAGFPAPSGTDLSFEDVKAGLSARTHAYSISGNPADIVGPSPLKRTAVAHEFAVTDIRNGGSEVLVYDGMRAAGPRKRGEWRPSSEVRQFAFKRAGKLDFVLAYPIGGWTQAKLSTQGLRSKVRELNAELDEADRTVARVRLARDDWKAKHAIEKAGHARERDVSAGLRLQLEQCGDHSLRDCWERLRGFVDGEIE